MGIQTIKKGYGKELTALNKLAGIYAGYVGNYDPYSYEPLGFIHDRLLAIASHLEGCGEDYNKVLSVFFTYEHLNEIFKAK